jgi:HNH endonuclease/AP2 domain
MDDIREYIEEYLGWDFENGELWWKKRSNPRVRIGVYINNQSKRGYKKVSIKGRYYMVHRVLFYLYYGYLPEEVDHINRIRIDNRIVNLRAATSAENACNQKKKSNNTSGYKGVSWYKRYNKWRAAVCKDNRHYTIGYFDDVVEAAKSYNKKALELHGEFAKLNEVSNG